MGRGHGLLPDAARLSSVYPVIISLGTVGSLRSGFILTLVD